MCRVVTLCGYVTKHLKKTSKYVPVLNISLSYVYACTYLHYVITLVLHKCI